MNQELTVKSLQDAGITAQINQNDIIEIIVQKKMDEFVAIVQALADESNTIYEEWKSIRAKNEEDFCTQLEKFIPHFSKKSVQFTTNGVVKKSGNGCGGYSHVLLDNPYIGESGDIISLCNKQQSIPNEEIGMRFFYSDSTNSEEIVNGMTIKTNTSKVYDIEYIIKMDVINPIIEKAAIFNEKYEEYSKKLRVKSFNVVKITRDVKTKLNKQILKKQAPSILNQIEVLFGVSLKD